MCTPKLTSVTPKPGHKLLLTYETGEHRLFDVSPYITGSWYGELRDNAYFSSVSLLPGGVGIEWLHGQDIAPHELYELSIPTKKIPPPVLAHRGRRDPKKIIKLTPGAWEF